MSLNLFNGRLHGHWQNLDTRRKPGGGRFHDEETKGKGWRNGRAWLRLTRDDGRDDFRQQREWRIQWVLPKKAIYPLSLSAELGAGDANSDADFSINLGVVSLYLSARTPLTRRLSKRLIHDWEERQVGVSMGWNATVRWHLWTETMGGSSRTPRWRDGHWNPVDALLGRRRYTHEDLSTVDVIVPMPEGSYAGTVTLNRHSSWRSRLPWLKSVRDGATINVPGGIPVEGKGENAWDCGEDGIWGTGSSDGTVEGAIANMVRAVMRKRARYGTPESVRAKPVVMAKREAVG
jgi:hypothetical protein